MEKLTVEEKHQGKGSMASNTISLWAGSTTPKDVGPSEFTIWQLFECDISLSFVLRREVGRSHEYHMCSELKPGEVGCLFREGNRMSNHEHQVKKTEQLRAVQAAENTEMEKGREILSIWM